MGKEKMLVTSIFSFSHNVFYPSQNKFQFFRQIFICHLQMLSLRSSLKICRLVKSYVKVLYSIRLIPSPAKLIYRIGIIFTRSIHPFLAAENCFNVVFCGEVAICMEKMLIGLLVKKQKKKKPRDCMVVSVIWLKG